ncbi:hypothetical protein B0H34DRAFT_479314 [Crassisporium funariophilum]|nr:hypothetical protein B0H34DRAFT_479314 [Crassisporium funariophilum]
MAFFLSSSASNSASTSLASSPAPRKVDENPNGSLHRGSPRDKESTAHLDSGIGLGLDNAHVEYHERPGGSEYDDGDSRTGFEFGFDLGRVLGSESSSSGFGLTESESGSEPEVESTRRATVGDTSGISSRMRLSSRSRSRSPSAGVRSPSPSPRRRIRDMNVDQMPRTQTRAIPAPQTLRAPQQKLEEMVASTSRLPSAEVGADTRHRKTRSSGETNDRDRATRRTTRTNTRQNRGWDSTRVVHEGYFSRDFLLIVALCIGMASACIVLARPALMKWRFGDNGNGYLDGFGYTGYTDGFDYEVDI